MKLRLLPRLLVCILTPCILCMLVMVMLSQRQVSHALQKEIEDELRLVATLQARELDNLFNIIFGVGAYFSTDPVLNKLLTTNPDTPGYAAIVAETKSNLVSLTTTFDSIATAGVSDARNIVRAHTNDAILGVDLSTRHYIREAAQKGKQSYEVVIPTGAATLSMLLGSPVFDSDGKTILGVIFLNIRLEELSAITIEALRKGNTGYAFVLDEKGIFTMHPDKDMLRQDATPHAWARAMLSSQGGIMEYDWEGARKKAAYAKVPSTNMTVVIAVEMPELMQSARTLFISNLMLALCSVILVALIVFFVARGISGSLQYVVALVRKIESGDFKFSDEELRRNAIALKKQDEVAELIQGINHMRESLKQFFEESEHKTQAAEKATQEAQVAAAAAEEAKSQSMQARREGMLAAAGSLEEVVAVFSSTSAQLSAQIESSGQRASIQAARVADTATAMEEMNSTVLEVARNAANAAKTSDDTHTKAATGAQVVEKAVESIRIVHQQSDTLKSSMQELDSNAKAVSQIMGVISDIADQTNLLALNAAIEAARAGEAGRGFAVVADEVRKLAEKTMASTADVHKAIQAIQTSVDQSSRLADESAQGIEKATDFANQSGQSLQEIVSMVESSADQVRAIAAASEQQSATSEEINRSVGEVNSIAEETASAMREAAKAVEELVHQSKVLAALVEDMKKG